ncbi:8-oxo-dGTP diphosphatase MutT [Paenibacillus herberti]|uniref:8-oxo-dGTP diphosphatase n=1 Tax=Paenibacillus herberti TaxID=1619309 RepID=A0A229NVP4_9BACL|nr:8-oxo-dGTP diphosphatase MutT [Paenibacillus herberti]OXM13938.1 8-oxo-dGTP diphosphatase MutT [Paenibacillus herberti]
MIEVAAAIIENELGQILIARRRKGKAQEGFWEFPGGKIESSETAEECLKRELLEEMNISIDPYEAFGLNDHSYGTTQIRLYAYRARLVSGNIILVDHDEYKWVYANELTEFEFAPADIAFVERLREERS